MKYIIAKICTLPFLLAILDMTQAEEDGTVVPEPMTMTLSLLVTHPHF